MLYVVELLMFLADAGMANSLAMKASVLIPEFILEWRKMEAERPLL